MADAVRLLLGAAGLTWGARLLRILVPNYSVLCVAGIKNVGKSQPCMVSKWRASYLIWQTATRLLKQSRLCGSAAISPWPSGCAARS